MKIEQVRVNQVVTEIAEGIRAYEGEFFSFDDKGEEIGNTFSVYSVSLDGTRANVNPRIRDDLDLADEDREIKFAKMLPAAHFIISQVIINPETNTYTGDVKLKVALEDYEM